jgi:hypothetical protein
MYAKGGLISCPPPAASVPPAASLPVRTGRARVTASRRTGPAQVPSHGEPSRVRGTARTGFRDGPSSRRQDRGGSSTRKGGAHSAAKARPAMGPRPPAWRMSGPNSMCLQSRANRTRGPEGVLDWDSRRQADPLSRPPPPPWPGGAAPRHGGKADTASVSVAVGGGDRGVPLPYPGRPEESPLVVLGEQLQGRLVRSRPARIEDERQGRSSGGEGVRSSLAERGLRPPPLC